MDARQEYKRLLQNTDKAAWELKQDRTDAVPQSAEQADKGAPLAEDAPLNYENKHEIYPDPNHFEVKKNIGRLG